MIVAWGRAKTILGLALPIAFALVIQNVMSLVSIAMVGHLGDAAVAGIGVAGTLFSMLLAVLFGLDTGVQAVVARRAGAGALRLAGGTLNDAILISGLAGLLLAAVAWVAGPRALALLVDDPAVIAQGTPYLIALCPMLLFTGANFAFSAWWNGAGVPKLSLLAILIQLPFNIVFSYVLIFGAFGLPRLGTMGAGLGTTLAALVGLAVHIVLATRIVPVRGFLQRPPTWAGIATLLRIGLPVSVQQFLLYVGLAVYFAIIARLGTREIAAVNVMAALMLLSIFTATGLGIAAGTLVGQALGRNDIADAKRRGWEAGWVGALLIVPLSLLILMTPRSTLGLFIADDATIALAVMPLRLLALSMCIDTVGRVLAFALRGAGATRLQTMVAFGLQWCIQLPLCWYVGVSLGHGLVGIALVRLFLYALEAVILGFIWHRGHWSRVRILDASRDTPAVLESSQS
jgi:putative MATE family efflux protein